MLFLDVGTLFQLPVLALEFSIRYETPDLRAPGDGLAFLGCDESGEGGVVSLTDDVHPLRVELVGNTEYTSKLSGTLRAVTFGDVDVSDSLKLLAGGID